MALSIANNIANISAQNNLVRTNANLSKSLERLSSDLKINRGADGPAALVISEQQRAKISNLQSAIENTNKAVSLVQTGEGALSEVDQLLSRVRSLALDSANTGAPDILVANQEEIRNALGRIDSITQSARFGTQPIFEDQTLTFQIGADAENVNFSLSRVLTGTLGRGATENVSSLSAIDVRSTSGAEDALAVVDQAISEIANLHSAFGAFQSNTLTSAGNSLRANLERSVSSELPIRDGVYATQIAQFTRNQVLLQAGTTVLGNANQIPQLVASLLRG